MEAERARRRASLRQARGRDEAARQAGLRAACEDDDGYDPYSDYMDALSRSGAEAPCADPWN